MALADLLFLRAKAGHGAKENVAVRCPRLHRSPQPRIQRVPDPVAQQVERQHRQRDRRTGKQHQPPRRHQPGVQRVGQHVAPGRRRRRNANAQKPQRRLDDDRHAQMRGRQDQIRRDALRQDMPHHHARMRGAQAAGRFDVGHFLQRQHDRADDPAAERYSGDGDGNDHRADAGAQRHRDRHRQDQVGERLQELDQPLADQIELAAEVAAGQAPERTERGAQYDRRHRNGQRRAAAVDHPAQRVAADLVGAELVQLGRRFGHVPEVGFQRRIQRQRRRRDRNDDDQRGDAAPERRHRRTPREGPQRARHARDQRPGCADRFDPVAAVR